MLIGMAIDTHVTISQRGRAKIEQAQLARSVFRLIGDDLRSTILYAPLDFSSVANLNLDADVGGGVPDPGSGDLGSGAIPGGAGGASGGVPGGASGIPGGATGSSQSGGSGTSGGTSSSGTSSGGSTSSDTGSLLDDATTADEDTPGVYGTAYDIQLDISRLPRVDEYETMIQNGRGAIADLPSDVKTVAYYCTGGSNAATSPGGPLSGDAEGGLVRRSVDRAVTKYAFENGSTAALDDSAAVLAPEVTEISFMYFDGSNWTDYWDMVEQGVPPLAVEITIVVEAPRVQSIFERVVSSGGDEVATTVYSQVVYLPTAEGGGGSGTGTSTDSTSDTSDASGTGATP